MSNASFCTICKRAGAMWFLCVDKDAQRLVHKPCGDRVVKMAPEGSIVKIIPSAQLRKQWDEERRERDARAFWTEKFKDAEQSAPKRKIVPSIPKEMIPA